MIYDKEGEPVIVVPAGGSGCISIEDGLLNLTPNVIGITGVHDDGGDSGQRRILMGVLPPGDINRRFAVRARHDPVLREFFLHRDGNGQRVANSFYATMEKILGSHIKAALWIEEKFKNDLTGRVIPISDDDIHITALMDDGSELEGETNIDRRPTNTPRIADIEFTPDPPEPNPKALEFLETADMILLPPTDLWTSEIPILKTPGVKEAIRANKKGVLVWVCNTTTKFAETDGYTTSSFAEKVCQVLGREIDHAFVNVPSHEFPPSYANSNSYPVENDLSDRSPYAHKVHLGNFTRVEMFNGFPVVRHNPQISAQAIWEVLTTK